MQGPRARQVIDKIRYMLKSLNDNCGSPNVTRADYATCKAPSGLASITTREAPSYPINFSPVGGVFRNGCISGCNAGGYTSFASSDTVGDCCFGFGGNWRSYLIC
jgi:hypothetical protein